MKACFREYGSALLPGFRPGPVQRERVMVALGFACFSFLRILLFIVRNREDARKIYEYQF